MVRIHSSLHGQAGRPQQHVSDILRGSLVLAVAALDALVSSSVAAQLPKLMRSGSIDDAMQKWIKANPDAVADSFASDDPVRAIATSLEERLLLKSSYQRVESIQRVLSEFADCEVDWSDVAERANTSRAGRKRTWTDDGVRRRLNAFVERRNAIAHQGDLKANGSSATPIQRAYVEEAIALVKCTGQHICVVVKRRAQVL